MNDPEFPSLFEEAYFQLWCQKTREQMWEKFIAIPYFSSADRDNFRRLLVVYFSKTKLPAVEYAKLMQFFTLMRDYQSGETPESLERKRQEAELRLLELSKNLTVADFKEIYLNQP